MAIKRADEEDLSRVEELTLRTSQMNATGVHYSDADLRALLADPDHEVLTVTLTDRFGPHGAVSIVFLCSVDSNDFVVQEHEVLDVAFHRIEDVTEWHHASRAARA